MPTNRPDDLAGLLNAPGGPDFQLYQGVVTAWNPATGANTVELAGGRELTDLPFLNTADATFIQVGTVVGLTRWKTRYYISGVVSTPPNVPTLPGGGNGGAESLNDLNDVSTSGASNGDVLTFSNGVWVPDAVPMTGNGKVAQVVTATLTSDSSTTSSSFTSTGLTLAISAQANSVLLATVSATIIAERDASFGDVDVAFRIRNTTNAATFQGAESVIFMDGDPPEYVELPLVLHGRYAASSAGARTISFQFRTFNSPSVWVNGADHTALLTVMEVRP